MHAILVLIAGAQMLLINDHADIFSGARGFNISPSLHLHPCFVSESNEDPGESLHMRRLARAFTAR